MQQAAELSVAAPTIEAALDGRFLSGLKEERVEAAELFAGLGAKAPSVVSVRCVSKSVAWRAGRRLSASPVRRMACCAHALGTWRRQLEAEAGSPYALPTSDNAFLGNIAAAVAIGCLPNASLAETQCMWGGDRPLFTPEHGD